MPVHFSRSWRLSGACRAVGQTMADVAAAVRRRGSGPEAAAERTNGPDWLRPPGRRSKPQQGKSSPRLLRTLSLKEIHGPCLSYDHLIEGRDAGYAELFPTIRLERSGSLSPLSPHFCHFLR